jgi:hypothetical protein
MQTITRDELRSLLDTRPPVLVEALPAAVHNAGAVAR